MMSLDALKIELDLAWRRVVADSAHRHFVTHPHLRDWVEHDRQEWLQRLASEIDAGYAARPCHLCLAPKAAALVRPGAVLCPEDEVIYTWLVGRCHTAVWQSLQWSQGNPDCAYQLLPPVEDRYSKKAVHWIRGGVKAWTSFRQKSLTLLTPEVSHVVISDVTGFYDNIDLPRLISDLKVVGASTLDLDLLSSCLRRWNHPRGKGIPQGYTASDILAKVYAHPLDRALRNEGFVHLRFVDDIRIFCKSKKEARQAIVRLTELLLARGLNLQAAKTKIYTKSEGKSEIEGIAEKLGEVTNELLRDLKIKVTLGGYVPTHVFFTLLKRKSSEASPAVLEKTFKEELSASSEQPFDKTLFHFLLGRLAAVGSRVAVAYCLQMLEERPEETDHILRYCALVGLQLPELDSLISAAESPEIILDYQLFQLLRWFLEHSIENSRILQLARRWAHDQNRAPWLRSHSLAYVGRYGNTADLDSLEQRYPLLSAELEKADYAAALERLEIGRRNAFYAKAKADGDWVRRAIAVVKAL